jgi:hypothetical protein
VPHTPQNQGRTLFLQLRFSFWVKGGMTKSRILSAVFGSLLAIAGFAVAQGPPVKNISGGRHPNLAAAQRLSQQAWERIVAAQQANEWDLQGHAQKAKGLLDEANRELKLAAEVANRNGKAK